MSDREKIQIEVELPSQVLHVQHARCPNGHLLQDNTMKIHDHPAIRVRVDHQKKSGELYLDPVYGSYDNIEKGIELPDGAIVEMFCPHCSISLKDPEETCQLCSAPLFIFHLPGNGIVEGCMRKGCLYHKMKIIDAGEQLGRLFENNTLESFL